MPTHFYSPEGLERGPWYWGRPGGELMLFTAHSGSRVVLSACPKRGQLQTRGLDGRLVPLTAEHPVARVIQALPDSMLLLVSLQTELRGHENEAGAETTAGKRFGVLATRVEAALLAAGYVGKEA